MQFARIRIFRFLFVLVLCLICGSSWAASFQLIYEKSITDPYGNNLGYQRTPITSIDDLPSSSPWRNYLNQKVDTRSVLTYFQDISKSLSRPLTITISDKANVSSSYKNTNGFSIDLYKHVTQYASTDSQKFVALHELGHVAMLNAYPSTYNFNGLDYGADKVHYMDEILPNQKTAWVEGWANSFAAQKNNGKVFSMSLGNDSILAFLKTNTFEEMTRNELFVAKTVFDVMATFPTGRDKVFNTISRNGPHNSLREFCSGFLSLYPQDQVSLAKLLDKNSQGKISLTELLSYVNKGSNVVSRELYNYIQNRTSPTPTTTTTQKSLWARIADFFSGLFGGKGSQTVTASTGASQAVSTTISPSISIGATGPRVSGNAESSPTSSNVNSEVIPGVGTVTSNGTPLDLASAQEEYFRAFEAYNQAISKLSPDSPEVKATKIKLQDAKATLERIRQQMNSSSR